MLQAGLALGRGGLLLRGVRGLVALGLQLCDALADLWHGRQGRLFAFQDGGGTLAEVGRADVQHLGADDHIGALQLGLAQFLAHDGDRLVQRA